MNAAGKRLVQPWEIRPPSPQMSDARWHKYGPRVFDRVQIRPSSFWATLRGEPMGDPDEWDGLTGTVVMESPFGPWVGVRVDRPPWRHRRSRCCFGRKHDHDWCVHIWHPDELELLALRVPGEVPMLLHPYLRVIK